MCRINLTKQRSFCDREDSVASLHPTFITQLYILWSELSWRKLSSMLATSAHYSCPDNAIWLVAQCELSGYVELEAVGRKFSHRPGNSATVGVVRWPSVGDTAGYRLCRPKLTPVSLVSMVYEFLICCHYR